MKEHRILAPRDEEAAEQALCRAISTLRDAAEVRAFLTDLCTPAELQALKDRWLVAELLDQGLPYRQIHDRTGVSVTTMVLAILLICIIHALETYVLNPQIYGHHMHMNPVLVLIVLTIGGKLFGVWGLLLGIPIVNYVFRHAIRRPEERPAEA